MSKLEAIVARIRDSDECRVLEPAGIPRLREGDELPAELSAFYALTGGVVLFSTSLHPVIVSVPHEFVRSNPAIVDCECPEDMSDFWYIVARCGQEVVSIDCGSERLGRCYDSFWDRHGVPGSCAVIALSFAELLERLFASNGQEPYWLTADVGYGDAYD